MADDQAYRASIEGEAAHWDDIIASRLLAGEIPGSVDFRLFFTQHAMRMGWQPPCLGAIEISFRRREIRYVLETAAPRPGARILDLGCAAGWLSLELARRGAHVTSVDLSPANLALGRYAARTHARNFPYLYPHFVNLPCAAGGFGSVEYVQGDLNTIELPRGEYDAIVVWDSLHHIAALERLLGEVRGALKPGGRFIGVDHAGADARTVTFNAEIRPVIRDLFGWITAHDPVWLYEDIDRVARSRDWGVMAVDYDVRPIEECAAFLEQVRGEMLETIRSERPLETTTPARTLELIDADQGDPSPFEDVCAERLMPVLLDTFHADRFETVCPIVWERDLIPEPRSPQERVFQHYVSALLIGMGEGVIARKQAVGQWFVFNLTADPPAAGQAEALLGMPPDDTQTHIRNLTALVAHLRTGLDERQIHVNNLEATIAQLKARGEPPA
jgi:SAM-dependent methyltransferase